MLIAPGLFPEAILRRQMRRGYGATAAEAVASGQMLMRRSISPDSVSNDVTSLTSVSPFRGARSGASDRVLQSWNTAPAARHLSTIAFGATTNTSLASVGHARRTPGVPARPRASRRAEAF